MKLNQVIFLCLILSSNYTYGTSIDSNDPSTDELGGILSEYKNIQSRDNQNKHANVILALSGGGLRAANFSLGAMLALEDTEIFGSDLLNEVDYFSTVSGGGLAGAAYLSSRLSQDCLPRKTFKLIEHISQDSSFLKKLRSGFIIDKKTFKILSPKILFTYKDRGDVLQQIITERFFTHHEKIDDCDPTTLNNSTEILLKHIFPAADSSQDPTVPYIFANATNHENGEVFSFTPGHLERQAVTCYVHNIEKTAVDDYYSMPLALGIRASASFPVGVANVTLDVDRTNSKYCRNRLKRENGDIDWEFIRLTDGGQSDNLGISTALDLLQYEDSKPSHVSNDHETILNKTNLLIIVDAFNGNTTSTSSIEGSGKFFAEILKSTDLPLAAFRNITKKTLSSADAKAISSIDSLGSHSDINVAYVNMDNLTKEYRDSDTVKDTILGLSEEKQLNIIIAGAYQMYSALGIQDAKGRVEKLLSSIFSNENLDFETPTIKANITLKDKDPVEIIRFAKFKKQHYRSKTVKDIQQKFSNIQNHLPQLLSDVRMFLVRHEDIKTRQLISTKDIELKEKYGVKDEIPNVVTDPQTVDDFEDVIKKLNDANTLILEIKKIVDKNKAGAAKEIVDELNLNIKTYQESIEKIIKYINTIPFPSELKNGNFSQLESDTTTTDSLYDEIVKLLHENDLITFKIFYKNKNITGQLTKVENSFLRKARKKLAQSANEIIAYNSYNKELRNYTDIQINAFYNYISTKIESEPEILNITNVINKNSIITHDQRALNAFPNDQAEQRAECASILQTHNNINSQILLFRKSKSIFNKPLYNDVCIEDEVLCERIHSNIAKSESLLDQLINDTQNQHVYWPDLFSREEININDLKDEIASIDSISYTYNNSACKAE